MNNDRLDPTNTTERYVPLDRFPSPADLWTRYCHARHITPAEQAIVSQDWQLGTLVYRQRVRLLFIIRQDAHIAVYLSRPAITPFLDSLQPEKIRLALQV